MWIKEEWVFGRRVFIWNGPWEGSDLVIFGYRVWAKRERDTRREWKGGERERMWRRDKGGLVFIITITNCHCCHLPPTPFSPRPFFSFLSCLLAACRRESRLQILWRNINSAVLMAALSGLPIQKTNKQQTDVNFRLALHECTHSKTASIVQSFAVLTPAQVAVCETPAWWGLSSSSGTREEDVRSEVCFCKYNGPKQSAHNY